MFLEELLQNEARGAAGCLPDQLADLSGAEAVPAPLLLFLPPEAPSGTDLQMHFSNAG